MAELNMGHVIQRKRKEKELTQEELAKLMGVSKSSVSKWETGQTYPDIYLLPELATYFNISIDTLMGYEPSLTKKQIRDIYTELSEKFGTEPFEEVFEEFERLIKKYYASDSFLIQMATLLLNYSNFADKSRQKDMLDYIIKLAKRVKSETTEASLLTQANTLEAFCQLQLGEVDETLKLLNHEVTLYMGQEQILSQAYVLKGDMKRAQEVLQITQYQHLIGLVVTSGDELALEVSNLEKYDEVVKRIRGLADIFDMTNLHPFLLITFLNQVFIGYTQQFRFEKALKVMREIVDMMVSQVFPVELHGDGYFNLLDEWMLEHPIVNTSMPRDEKTIKSSLIQFYETHPGITTAFKGNQEFQEILTKLKENNGDNK